MTQNGPIQHIVIVGGGTAGWLTAGLLASEHGGEGPEAVRVTLVESPDVKTIGVGEGTWPTMRGTLARIGIPEREFLTECQAAFKQGTRFDRWVTGAEDDRYYHPFTAPSGYPGFDVAAHWLREREKVSFVDASSPQGYLCDRGLAPKELAAPDYAGVANYGYHLDAGRFAGLLARHGTERLGVSHILDHVTAVNGDPDGNIPSITTRNHGELAADLFIDCTGLASLLIGRHYGIGLLELDDVLFNNAALAVQVPYEDPEAPIACQTISTAQDVGWVWDIGLQNRRGVGYVYSTAHASDDEAHATLARHLGVEPDRIEPRKIGFRPSHRERFWHRNCVAIGMSAGFLEPLEASALVLVELSARAISDAMPQDRDDMARQAERFNTGFRYRWERIVEFLKLHYVLSQRDSQYWDDNRNAESIPPALVESLERWRHHVPVPDDLPRHDEVFSAASYQYVLYGMDFDSSLRRSARFDRERERAVGFFNDNIRRANRLVAQLPAHRRLLEALAARPATPGAAGGRS
ncbi:MAG: tryptophan halogenase family protein [Pseudomonadota bacterium]